ncbi:CHAT domain-containing protein [Prevotella sp.]|uniref:CHAT domain-containing protein n=1 Tax=Prevotella sp. TaxID=59823 RepID=UPI0040296C04
MKGMMSKVLLLFALLSFSPFTGKAQDHFFSDQVVDDYFMAYDLNEKKEYIKAFDLLKKVEIEMDNSLSQKGITVTDLHEDDFLMPYWAVKKSLGEVAYKLGLYKEMDAYSKGLMDIFGKHVFKEQANYNTCLADLYRIAGNSCFLQGIYQEAEAYLKMALPMKSADFDFADALRDDLAQIYYQQGRYSEAITQLDSILAGPRYKENARVRGMESLRQEIMSQRALCLARNGKYNEAYEIMQSILGYFKQHRDDKRRAEALRKTAKILMLKYDGTGIYNPQALQYYKEYLALSKKFIDQNFVRMSASEREQYWLAEQPFATDCYRLEGRDAGFLYDVALFSKAILLQMNRQFKPDMSLSNRKQTLSSIRTTWLDVKRAMPRGSSAIEFITYEKRGEIYIGALVINKESKSPEFVEIISYDSLFNYPLENGITLGEALSSNESEMKNLIYRNLNLRNLIWNRKLINVIGQSKSIYFAADDLLHLLAIEYLLPEKLERKPFYRMTSTRLLAERSHKQKISNVLFCGGVNYESKEKEEEGKNNDKVAYYRMSHEIMGLPYLSGSLTEVDSISIYRNNPKDSILVGMQASEGVLRNLLGKYSVIHLATHGYLSNSASYASDLIPASADEQLSNSCLFLAGAESCMSNSSFLIWKVHIKSV